MKFSPLKILLLSLRDLWDDLWTVLICNLVWLISVLLFIPGPPVTLALFYYTNQSVHGEAVNVSDFFKAIPRFWWSAWRWGVINLLVLAILIGDFILTGQQNQSIIYPLLRGSYITIITFWIFLQIFTLPFLFEQEKTSILLALRNGAVMIGKNLGFSLILLILLLTTLSVGILAFMLSVAFGGALVAFAGNRAVINRLEFIK